MAATASNKTNSKRDVKFPEIEEQALQFILDCCESSIAKYSRFLQVSEFFYNGDTSMQMYFVLGETILKNVLNFGDF